MDKFEASPNKDESRYWQLDRFMLFVFAAEFVYFLLMLSVGLALWFFFRTSPYETLWTHSGVLATLDLWQALALAPFFVAPVHFAVAPLSMVLYIRAKHKGYPGTGHLLNWIVVLVSGSVLIPILLDVISQLTRRPI